VRLFPRRLVGMVHPVLVGKKQAGDPFHGVGAGFACYRAYG